ncbi:MAG TPA: methyltransferase domain-containing protein [Solirubrobacteraceae bacterium]|jgi:SAM-dependent methyltransferase
MTEEHREASRAQWEQAAKGWAAEAEERERGPVGRAADRMLEAAAPRPGERVVELACGAGDVGLRAAEAVGPDGRVLLTDFAEPMVELVRERARDLPQVDARTLDAEDPNLGERFDVALCRLGYMLMPDPARALRATHDLLEPGGRLALAVWAEAGRNPWLSLLFDAVMGVLGAPPPAPGMPGPFALGDPARVEELVSAAGFTDVVVDEVEDVRAFASPEAWWEEMRSNAGGPIATVLAALPEEQRARIGDRAMAAARPFADAGGLRFLATLVVASGVRRS